MSKGRERERILSIRTIRPFLMSPKPNTTPGRARASSSGAAVFSAPVISLTSPRCSFTLNTLCRNLSCRDGAPFLHLCVHTHAGKQRAVVPPGHTRAELRAAGRGSQEPESDPKHSCCCCCCSFSLSLSVCLLPACWGTLGLCHHGCPSCLVQMMMRSRAPSSATSRNWLEDQSWFGATVAFPHKLGLGKMQRVLFCAIDEQRRRERCLHGPTGCFCCHLQDLPRCRQQEVIIA